MTPLQTMSDAELLQLLDLHVAAVQIMLRMLEEQRAEGEALRLEMLRRELAARQAPAEVAALLARVGAGS